MNVGEDYPFSTPDRLDRGKTNMFAHYVLEINNEFENLYNWQLRAEQRKLLLTGFKTKFTKIIKELLKKCCSSKKNL